MVRKLIVGVFVTCAVTIQPVAAATPLAVAQFIYSAYEQLKGFQEMTGGGFIPGEAAFH